MNPKPQRRFAIAVVCVLILMGLAVLARGPGRRWLEGRDPKGAGGLAVQSFDPVRLSVKTSKNPAVPPGLPAKVLRIIDGDTLHVRLEGKVVKVRLLDVNTPEMGSHLYREATETLAALAGRGDLWLVPAEPDRFTLGRMGRLLAYVFRDGRNLNLELVRSGMSRYFTNFGPGRFPKRFKKAQEDARRSASGLWKQE